MLKLEEKLKTLMGRTWMYKTINYDFLSYRNENGKILIATNHRWFEFTKMEEVELFLQDLLPVEKEPTALALSIPDSKSNNIMAQLKGILIENINAVREDKEYVPQAQMVSKSIQTLINLQKLEIQMVRGNGRRP